MAFAVVLLVGAGAFAKSQEEKSNQAERASGAEPDRKDLVEMARKEQEKITKNVEDALKRAGADQNTREYTHTALDVQHKANAKILLGKDKDAVGGSIPAMDPVDEAILGTLVKIAKAVGKFTVQALCNGEYPANEEEALKCIREQQDWADANGGNNSRPKKVHDEAENIKSFILGDICYPACTRYTCGHKDVRRVCMEICCRYAGRTPSGHIFPIKDNNPIWNGCHNNISLFDF